MLSFDGCGISKEKAAWQMYASINGVTPTEANEVSKMIDQYNKAFVHVGDDEKRISNRSSLLTINILMYTKDQYHIKE